MHTFFADLRYGARLLSRSPGFTFVAIAALAIGIGANLTIFGFAKELLVSPPAGIADPDRVARTFTNRFSATPLAHYEAYRDASRSFAALAAFQARSVNLRTDSNTRGYLTSGEGSPEQIFALSVSGNYFQALGVSAAVGRAIEPSDDRPGAPGVVVLSDGWWSTRFGRSPAALGQTLTINGRLHTIVGITPPRFTGTMAPIVPDLFLPLVESTRAASDSVQMIGRLQRDATLGEAQAELTTLATQLARSDDRVPPMVTVYPARALAPELALPAAVFTGLLLAVVGVVLVLACVNIANLLLARSVDRAREISMRLALGASRRRLVRQLLTESLLLSAIGGAAAGVVALAAARPITAAVASLPTPIPLGLAFTVDWRLAAAAIGLAVTTTLVFGLVPALQSSKPDVLPALKEGANSAGPTRSKLRAIFMTTQIAMSTLLLVLAGLLVRGLMSAHVVDRGLVTTGVLAASVDLESAGYTPERGIAFYDRLRDRLEQSPGITANIVEIVPIMLSNRANEMVKEAAGAATAGDDEAVVYQNIVSPAHFRALGIPLVAGRDFDAGDRTGAVPVVIVNEMLARRFWPTQSPLGKRLRQRNGRESFGPWLEVIGVARDSKYVTVGEDPRLFMYQPLAQVYRSAATILVKSTGNAMDALPTLRATVRELDPNLAIFGVMTLDAATSISILPVKVAASLTTALGTLALALGAIGLYGVMSYLVRQRTREIGIRMALGAHAGAVVRTVTRQGMRWTAIGVLLGLSGAFGVARLIVGFLYGVGPADPVAFGIVTLLLTATAFVACYIPARRASRIDPLVALRDE
jgi:putative ABC transport system permease protein